MLDLNGIRGLAAPCSDARTASEEIMLDEGEWEAVTLPPCSTSHSRISSARG